MPQFLDNCSSLSTWKQNVWGASNSTWSIVDNRIKGDITTSVACTDSIMYDIGVVTATEIEIFAIFHISSNTTNVYGPGVLFRATGSAGSENGYAVVSYSIRPGKIRLIKLTNGTKTLLTEVNVNKELSSSDKLYIRAKVTKDNLWYFKHWISNIDASVDEPITWDVVAYSDSTYTDPGYVGFMGGSYSLSDPTLYHFSVGTGGEEAPIRIKQGIKSETTSMLGSSPHRTLVENPSLTDMQRDPLVIKPQPIPQAPALIKPRVWTQQPPSLQPLNPEFSSGLWFLLCPSMGYTNLGYGRTEAYMDNDVAIINTKDGKAFYFDIASGIAGNIASPQPSVLNYSFSAVTVFSVIVLYSQVEDSYDMGNTSLHGGIFNTQSDGYCYRPYYVNIDVSNKVTNLLAPVNTVLCVATSYFSDKYTVSSVLNGKLSTNTLANPTVISAFYTQGGGTGRNRSIGPRNSYATCIDGHILLVGIAWNTAWSNEKLLNWSKNPWQIFSKQSRIWTPT